MFLQSKIVTLVVLLINLNNNMLLLNGNKIKTDNMRDTIYTNVIYKYINFKIAQRPTFLLDELNV